MSRNRAVAVVALLLIAGCASDRDAVREMSEQQTAMTQEHAQWRSQLGVWARTHDRIKAWHAQHPASSKEEGAVERLRHHEESLVEHESDASRFRGELAALDERLAQVARRGERERLTGQAPLWAEHLKLKLAYEGLEAAHQQLEREHAAFLADSAGARAATNAER